MHLHLFSAYWAHFLQPITARPNSLVHKPSGLCANHRTHLQIIARNPAQEHFRYRNARISLNELADSSATESLWWYQSLMAQSTVGASDARESGFLHEAEESEITILCTGGLYNSTHLLQQATSNKQPQAFVVTITRNMAARAISRKDRPPHHVSTAAPPGGCQQPSLDIEHASVYICHSALL